jgi:hypothetical protein
MDDWQRWTPGDELPWDSPLHWDYYAPEIVWIRWSEGMDHFKPEELADNRHFLDIAVTASLLDHEGVAELPGRADHHIATAAIWCLACGIGAIGVSPELAQRMLTPPPPPPPGGPENLQALAMPIAKSEAFHLATGLLGLLTYPVDGDDFKTVCHDLHDLKRNCNTPFQLHIIAAAYLLAQAYQHDPDRLPRLRDQFNDPTPEGNQQ